MGMPIPLHEDPPIPPELKRMPPREVRLKQDVLSGNVFKVLVFVVMGLFAIGGILFGVCEMAFIASAPIVPGHVIDMATREGSKGGRTYLVTYEFSDSGSIYTNTQTVSETYYHDLYDGAGVPVNTMVIASHRFEKIHVSWGEYFKESPVWFVAVFFGAMMLLLWRRRRVVLYGVVRDGEATIGIIESKKTYRTRNGRTYYVKYQYTDSQKCLRTGKRMNVKQVDYEELQQGDRVVVLFDPMKQGRSLIYKCGPYEAV